MNTAWAASGIATNSKALLKIVNDLYILILNYKNTYGIGAAGPSLRAVSRIILRRSGPSRDATTVAPRRDSRHFGGAGRSFHPEAGRPPDASLNVRIFPVGRPKLVASFSWPLLD